MDRKHGASPAHRSQRDHAIKAVTGECRSNVATIVHTDEREATVRLPRTLAIALPSQHFRNGLFSLSSVISLFGVCAVLALSQSRAIFFFLSPRNCVFQAHLISV